MRLSRLLILLMALLCLVASATAQLGAERAKWKSEVRDGRLVLVGTMDPGWHIYSVVKVEDGPYPTTIVAADSAIQVTETKDLNALTKFDKGFNKEVGLFERTAEIEVGVAPTGGALPATAKLNVTYQACDVGGCLPPKRVEVPVDLTGVTASDPPAVPATAATVTPTPPADPASSGLVPFFWVSFLAGFAALATPCVFPMIPITVSVFSKQGKAKGIGKAVAFSLGIIGTFTLLGVLTSAIAGATGLQYLANNPWVNLFLAGLFIFFAFNLFGMYEISLPSGLVNKVNPEGKSGFIAPVLMGFVFSLTSFTCTVPVVGTLLVTAAQGNYLTATVGMLGFSTAFALPFFLLAIFPQYLASLPKSGGWLAETKAYLGFLELAAAVKFLSNVDLAWNLAILTRPVFVASWVAILTLATLFVIGAIRIPHVETGRLTPVRGFFGAASLVLTLWVASALNGNTLGLLGSMFPPDPYPGVVTAQSSRESKWVSTYDAAVARAKEENKPLFIDFTGVFCTNCRYMESNVFPDPSVEKEFENFVLAKLYTDRPDNPDDQKHERIKLDLTKNAANPVYVILRPDGTMVSFLTYPTSPNLGEQIRVFREFLQAGYQSARGSTAGR